MDSFVPKNELETRRVQALSHMFLPSLDAYYWSDSSQNMPLAQVTACAPRPHPAQDDQGRCRAHHPYVGTLYGIFKGQAGAMGKGEWVESLAGTTARTVQMFKTTGVQMSTAFTGIGANATSAGGWHAVNGNLGPAVFTLTTYTGGGQTSTMSIQPKIIFVFDH
jgi:hypothetical protein